MKPLSPLERGLTFVFPPPLFLLAEAEAALALALPVEVAFDVPPGVMLPLGIVEGIPEDTPTAPMVGNG